MSVSLPVSPALLNPNICFLYVQMELNDLSKRAIFPIPIIPHSMDILEGRLSEGRGGPENGQNKG